MKSFGIYFEITNACNLRCRTCLPSSGKPRKAELTSDQIVQTVYRLYELGAHSIFFSGGEPFIRPDCIEILERIGLLNIPMSLVTNGLLVDTVALDVIQRHNIAVTVSVDGADVKAHEFIRGKETFHHTLERLQAIVSTGTKVTMAITVTAQNFGQLYALAKLARQFGCSHVLFTEVVQSGRALQNWSVLALTPSQRTSLYTQIETIAHEVFGDTVFGTDDSCWVDGSSLYITAEGDTYLCAEVFQRAPRLTVGNINCVDDFGKIVSSLQMDYAHHACCYYICASKHVTLIANLDRPCAFVQVWQNKDCISF